MKQLTLRRLILSILMVFFVPLLAFFAIYNTLAIKTIDGRIADNTRGKVKYYNLSLESMLKRTESFMIDMIANDNNFRQLGFSLSELDAHLNAYEVLAKYRGLIKTNPVIRGMFVFSLENGLYRTAYVEGLTLLEKEGIESYLKELVLSGVVNEKDWISAGIGESNYLLRILGNNSTYCISLVDFGLMEKAEELISLSDESLVFATPDMKPLTSVPELDSIGIGLSSYDPNSAYSVLRGDGKYFFVSEFSDYMGLYIISYTTYEGLFRYLDRFQLSVLAASLMFLVLLFVSLILMDRLIAFPLDVFVETMGRIKNGELDRKLVMPQDIAEFRKISTVFNEMIREITSLKIEKYEQKVLAQSAELQRLQIQIRPHFFLNCLKIFYAMAEQREFHKIQDMIISLSEYLRSLFNNREITVALEDEINSVEKYCDLYAKSNDTPLILNCNIEKGLEGFRIPSMAILTFVENSIKHAGVRGNPLKINISGKVLSNRSEAYVNLTVSDNGPGFNDSAMERINDKNRHEDETGGIGILNLKKRLRILYRDKFEITFLNRHGACVELFFVARIGNDGSVQNWEIRDAR